jgi:hypothetical protein
LTTVTIFWECIKSDVTDGFFHWVLEDIGQLIKENEKSMFDESLNPIEILFTQQFFCKNYRIWNTLRMVIIILDEKNNIG